jgi:hypothetical protein
MSLTRLLSTAVLALLLSPVTSSAQPMPATRVQELEASIAELKASREEAPEDMKKLLDKQIGSLQEAIKLQKMTDEANAQNKPRRAPLSDEMKAFFTPVAPAKVPAWIPDSLTRAQVTDELLKCPAGAKVFADTHAVDCRRPPATRGGIPQPHGLALWFHKSTGKLKAQRYYENGLLRWDISYHITGARSSEGLYDNEKPKQDRENGLHTSYAPNGTIVRQAEYKSGKLQGWSKLWEDDGYPMSASRYEDHKSVEMIGPTGNKR